MPRGVSILVLQAPRALGTVPVVRRRCPTCRSRRPPQRQSLPNCVATTARPASGATSPGASSARSSAGPAAGPSFSMSSSPLFVKRGSTPGSHARSIDRRRPRSYRTPSGWRRRASRARREGGTVRLVAAGWLETARGGGRSSGPGPKRNHEPIADLDVADRDPRARWGGMRDEEHVPRAWSRSFKPGLNFLPVLIRAQHGVLMTKVCRDCVVAVRD